MPTYDYVCDACDHQFERFQSMSDPVRRKCPECGRLKLRRLIGTGSAIIFKGSGFYQTDYRSESYKQGAKADKESSDTSKKSDKESSDTPKKSDKASDSKPDSSGGESTSGKSDD